MIHKDQAGMKDAIDHSLDCHRACLETIQSCLRAGGVCSQAAHISLLMNCAEMCRTNAVFLVSGSTLHHRTCAATAEVCEATARDLESLAAGDANLKSCAEACRRAADSCRWMNVPAAA